MGFCVARTQKGSGRGWVVPPTVTPRSCMASRTAGWVLGVARERGVLLEVWEAVTAEFVGHGWLVGWARGWRWGGAAGRCWPGQEATAARAQGSGVGSPSAGPFSWGRMELK